MTKSHFETVERTQALWKIWRKKTLLKMIAEKLDKNRIECLELLHNYFRKIKQGPLNIYRTDINLRDTLINAF